MNNCLKTAQHIQISEYDYALAEDKIARYPLDKRDESKLLVYHKGNIEESVFSNLPDFIEPDSLIVFNNTRVIPARLKFQKTTGAQIEIFCLEPCQPSDYFLALQANERCTWKCITGNLKKWKNESLVKTVCIGSILVNLTATKVKDNRTDQIIEFSWDNPIFSFADIIENVGVTPIPPYLNRDTEEIDRDRYQTVYSKVKGSVAAPTAGLHFSENTFNNLINKNIRTSNVTLHVGAGTFKPVQSETVENHEMHNEYFTVNRACLEQLTERSDKIIAVGTTTLRTLESLYWFGVKIKMGQYPINNTFFLSQWEPYTLSNTMDYKESIQVLLKYMMDNNFEEISANTQILIAPGYHVKSIKALVTNFHQPRSTLLLLVSAITGQNWKKIYEYALEHQFRFLSYGDSSIIFC